MKCINPAYTETIAKTVNGCPYFSLLSMSIKSLEMGRSVLEVNLETKHLQPFGLVHGGVFSSVIDAAAFWAVYTEVEESAGMTTVEMKLNYLAPAETGRLIACGRRIKIGKTLALGEASITDADGRQFAHGLATFMIMPGMNVQADSPLPPKFV
jgi:uncharacterized protein (TIGR00369 family)